MSIFRVGYIDWYCWAKALYLQQRMILIYFNHSCTLVTLFIFVCILTQMKNSSTENNYRLDYFPLPFLVGK